MFFQGFKESKMDSVSIPNISHPIFMNMLEYLYSGSVTINTENVMPLIHAVDQYGISDLRSDCFEFLVQKLTTVSACAMILDAQHGKYSFNCDELISSIMLYVEQHTQDILEMDVFLEFNERVIMEILQRDTLTISEVELFKSVIRWGMHQKQRLNKSLYEVVARLIPLIRFPLMDSLDLMRIVRPINVVSLDTYIEALEYAGAPESCKSVGKKYYMRDPVNSFDLDVPTNWKSNFSVKKHSCTKIGGGTSWQSCSVFGSKRLTHGKHSWEITIDNINVSDFSGFVVGVSTEKSKNSNSSYFSKDICLGMSASTYNCNVPSHTGTGTIGDRIGVLLDFQTLKVSFFKNGVYLGVFGSLVKGVSYFPVVHLYYTQNSFTLGFPKKPLILK